jgi:hypothetical protein
LVLLLLLWLFLPGTRDQRRLLVKTIGRLDAQLGLGNLENYSFAWKKRDLGSMRLECFLLKVDKTSRQFHPLKEEAEHLRFY